MGRWYNTQNHSGKFGFATQPSNDPEIFGMEEQPQNHIDYYLEDSEENRNKIIKTLDEQYDILQIPKEDRLYEIENEQQVENLLAKYRSKNYHEYDEAKDDKYCHKISFNFDQPHETYVPNNDKVELAECRVVLGLYILDDLQKNGYCDMEAEI